MALELLKIWYLSYNLQDYIIIALGYDFSYSLLTLDYVDPVFLYVLSHPKKKTSFYSLYFGSSIKEKKIESVFFFFFILQFGGRLDILTGCRRYLP